MSPDCSWNIRVELSTQPYYCCVLGMLGAVGLWAFTGVRLTDQPHWAVALAVIGLYGLFFGVAFAVGVLLHRMAGAKGRDVAFEPKLTNNE